jgi:hypothetical protein
MPDVGCLMPEARCPKGHGREAWGDWQKEIYKNKILGEGFFLIIVVLQNRIMTCMPDA